MKLVLRILAWPVTALLSALIWLGTEVLTRAASLLGLASALLILAALLVLITTSVPNGIILLVVAFLISPKGLPMLGVLLLGGLAGINETIKIHLYG